MSALPEGPSGTNGLGPPAPSIRRDRTWPGQSRQACVAWTERTRGSGARAPARRRPCQAKAASCEGGVARIRGRGARTGLLVEDFLFHAAATPISTRPPFSGSLGPTEGDARCPYVSGAAARAFAHSAFRLCACLLVSYRPLAQDLASCDILAQDRNFTHDTDWLRANQA